MTRLNIALYTVKAMSEIPASPVQNITPPIDEVPAPVAIDITPRKRNYIPWLLGILALAVVLGVSFLILTGNSKPSPTKSLIKPSVSPEQTTVAATDIDMSGWKTYIKLKT